MNKKIHQTPKKLNTSFKGDVLRLVSGNAITAAVGLVFMPIITRLFQPEAFGLLALFTSIITILSVLACLRYELSIVLPDNDQEAANLLSASLGFSFLMSLLTMFFVCFAGNLIVAWFKMPELKDYLWLIPLIVLFHGIFNALSYWNTRTKHFTRLAIAQITNQFAVHSTTLGAGLAGYATGGAMIVAAIGGKIISTVILAYKIWRDNSKFFIRNVRWKHIFAGIKRYRKFPIYGSWSILLGTGAWQLPVLMLGAFFSSTIVGFYSLGFLILQAPMKLIGSAIGKVFFQSASQAKAEGKLAHLVEDLFRRLTMISLAPILMLAIVGRDLYIFVFGANWSEAGVYTQILSLWAFLWFLSGPFTTLFAVIEKQEKQLKWNILNFTLRFFSILIGGFYHNARLAITLLGISGVIIYGYKIALTMNLAGVSLWKALKILIKYTLIFIPAGICVFSLSFFQVNRAFILLTAGLLLIAYEIWILYTCFLKKRR